MSWLWPHIDSSHEEYSSLWQAFRNTEWKFTLAPLALSDCLFFPFPWCLASKLSHSHRHSLPLSLSSPLSLSFLPTPSASPSPSLFLSFSPSFPHSLFALSCYILSLSIFKKDYISSLRSGNTWSASSYFFPLCTKLERLKFNSGSCWKPILFLKEQNYMINFKALKIQSA